MAVAKKNQKAKPAEAEKDFAAQRPIHAGNVVNINAEERAPVSAPLRMAGAREAILREMPEIVDGLISAAKDGSYQHAKFLFEFAGIDAAITETEDRGESSLAELLREELERGDTEG